MEIFPSYTITNMQPTAFTEALQDDAHGASSK
jgi:hypothetical protein